MVCVLSILVQDIKYFQSISFLYSNLMSFFTLLVERKQGKSFLIFYFLMIIINYYVNILWLFY